MYVHVFRVLPSSQRSQGNRDHHYVEPSESNTGTQLHYTPICCVYTHKHFFVSFFNLCSKRFTFHFFSPPLLNSSGISTALVWLGIHIEMELLLPCFTYYFLLAISSEKQTLETQLSSSNSQCLSCWVTK